MLNFVFEAIKQRLETAMGDKIVYIDWYAGQYLEAEMDGGGELLWATPAVFVEFKPVLWTTMGNGMQRGELIFSLHLVNTSFDTDHQRFTFIKDLNHFGLEAEVFRAVHGFRATLSYLPVFAGLAGVDGDAVLLETCSRFQSEPDHQMERLVLSVQTFRTTVYDYGAVPDWLEVTRGLCLDTNC